MKLNWLNLSYRLVRAKAEISRKKRAVFVGVVSISALEIGISLNKFMMCAETDGIGVGPLAPSPVLHVAHEWKKEKGRSEQK